MTGPINDETVSTLLLAEHATFGWDGDSHHRCRCGKILTGRATTDPIPAWTRHVINTLAAALRGNFRDARSRKALELRHAAEAHRQRANAWEAAGLPNTAKKSRDRAYRLLRDAEALEPS